MASPRLASSVLVLALLGAVLVLQVAAAESEVFVTKNVENTSSEVNGQSPATDLIDTELGPEFDDSTVEDVEAATVSGDEAEAELHEFETSDVDERSTNPLARLLWQQSSKRCYSTNSCKRFFKLPGCCKAECVNLSGDNKNCGKCGRRCNTKSGYSCHKGSCTKRKPHSPPSHAEGCNRYNKCTYGKSCCSSKCVSLLHDSLNCGKCGWKCGSGKVCCSGQCKDLSTDWYHCGQCGKKCSRGWLCCNGRCVDKDNFYHCGKCGVKCPFGHKCCSGKCVNVLSDRENCGSCNKECRKRCVYGMCEYN